jgi:S1-C subfamily serine protease
MLTRRFSLGVFAVLLLVASGLALAKGRLGFSVEAATNDGSTLTQVKVASVSPGSPAALAGLRAGDVITQLDGKPVEGLKDTQLKARLGSVKPGERIKLLVLRAEGKSVPIEILAAGDA